MTDSPLALALALVVFLFPLAFSPGPGNLFFAALGARGGLRSTVPAMAGYHLVTWPVTVAMGSGAAGVAQTLPFAMVGLKYVGGVYLLYLAHGLLRTGTSHVPRTPQTPRTQRAAGFGTGAALLVLNPKAYVIIALMFAQFADTARDPVGVMWIATVFTLNNLAAFTLWAVLGDRLAAVCGNGRRARWLTAGLASSLAGVGVWMLLT